MKPDACPKCGHDLAVYEMFTRGDLTVLHNCEVYWKGQRVRLSSCETLLVVALARARGAPMTVHALAEAMGYERDLPRNIVSVYVCRLRKAFRKTDPGFNCIGRGKQGGGDGSTRWLDGTEF